VNKLSLLTDRGLTNSGLSKKIGGMATIRFPTRPGEMLEARLNQPRVSLEYLRQQMERHRQASAEYAEAVKKDTSKPGRAKAAAGVTN
jgi:hypothetical protein